MAGTDKHPDNQKEKKCTASRMERYMLVAGAISEEHFWLLVELSPIHSEKVQMALRDYLVSGYSRKIVCEKHGVSNGYLSTSLGRLFRIGQIVSHLVPFYAVSEG